MEFKDLRNLLIELNIDIDPTSYWPPEQLLNAFLKLDRRVYHEAEYADGVMEQMRGIGQEGLLLAACILTYNQRPLQDRIEGKIKDDFLSSKNFGSIAENCVAALNRLPELTDWQIDLRESFIGMTDQHRAN